MNENPSELEIIESNQNVDTTDSNANIEDEQLNENESNTSTKKVKKIKPNNKKRRDGLSPTKHQTDPPRVSITDLFPEANYPEGQILPHPVPKHKQLLVKAASSITKPASRSRLSQPPSDTCQKKDESVIDIDELIASLRLAAEAHRQTRQYMKRYIQPGMTLLEICEKLERTARRLIGENGLEAGLAFPASCSLNHYAAHFTPNSDDSTMLQFNDVCKIDFGTHIKGHIIDSAFTLARNEIYSELLEAVRDATNTGIREAGIDVRLSDVGAAMQEVVESYEIELDNQIYQVKAIRNLSGHSIGPYIIHAGKTIPYKGGSEATVMEENECYAIECFGTTGRGVVHEALEPTQFMKNHYITQMVPLRLQTSRQLLNTINKNFGTLIFCKRWLDRMGVTKHHMALKDLADKRIVKSFMPMADIRGSYTAQYKHTILLRNSCKEVMSRGTDF